MNQLLAWSFAAHLNAQRATYLTTHTKHTKHQATGILNPTSNFFIQISNGQNGETMPGQRSVLAATGSGRAPLAWRRGQAIAPGLIGPVSRNSWSALPSRRCAGQVSAGPVLRQQELQGVRNRAIGSLSSAPLCALISSGHFLRGARREKGSR